MKLATYNPQVQQNTIGNARVQTFGDGGAAQALANIGRMQGQSLTGMANTIQHVGEQIDAVNVQAASNEYTKRLNELLYNQDNGLMNTQMQGADGITAKFEEEEKKIRQEVGKQYQFLSAKGSMVFNRMTDNSATQRYEMVRRHQTQQYNAYRDQTYNNALELNTQTAADNYAMPEVVDQNMAEAIASVRMRYADQGEEVVKAQERKAVGGIAQQVIGRAYANGDNDMAESYIERYGRYMPPEVVSGYAKNVYANKMAATQEVTAKSIFAMFGDNEEAAYNYINSEAFGGNGNVNNALTWYKNAEARGESLGENQCTVGLNKALVAGGYKPINTWAPTAWNEVKDTSRAFKDRSKLRPGDIVYWNTSSIPGEASHVGMYAGDGKVCQSGDSGIRTIPLDAYTVVGFSRPEGKAATPEDRKKMFAAYQKEAALRKRFETQATQRAMEAGDEEFYDLFASGQTDPGVYRAAATRIAGGDPKLTKKLIRAANGWASAVGKAVGAKKNAPLDPSFKPTMVRMMTEGGMTNQDIIDYMNDPKNAEKFTPKAVEATIQLLKQRIEGEGPFKYNWTGIESMVMQGYKGPDKAYKWKNTQGLLMYRINDFVVKNRRPPSDDEVIAMGQDLLTDGTTFQTPGKYYGTNDTKINSDKMRQAGIYYWQKNANGMYDVVMLNDAGTAYVRRRLSNADIAKIHEGAQAKELTGEYNYATR